MSNHFIKLSLSNIPEERLDGLTLYLFEHQAQGVSENLKFIQTSQQYDPQILKKELIDLDVFFNLVEKENLTSLTVREPLKGFHPKIEIEENRDWLEEWKKHYAPFCVEENLWVYPSWEASKVKKDQLALLVDPGLAFGTGTHATTELCMKALYRLLKSSDCYNSALDMGAGTGILSVLMKKMGLESVVACEIDEMAREKCEENLDLNGVQGVPVLPPESLRADSYDLVVANIIDGVLLKIKDQLFQAANKTLLLSGILKENEGAVTQSFVDLGLKLKERSDKEEWVCLLFEKK